MENLFAWKGPDGKNPEKERRNKVHERLALYNINARLTSYDRRKRARQLSGRVDPELEFARMRVQHVLESSALTDDTSVREALEAIDLINGKLAVAGIALDVPAQDLEGPIEAPLGEIEPEDFGYAIHNKQLQQAGEDLEESKNEYYALYRRFRAGEAELTPARRDLLNKANADVRESIAHFARTYRALMEERHPGVSYRTQEQAIIESAYAKTPTLTESGRVSHPQSWALPEVALPQTRSGPAVETVRKQDPLRMREYAGAVAAALVLFGVGVQLGKPAESPRAPVTAERLEAAPPAPDLHAFAQEAPQQEPPLEEVVQTQEAPAPEPADPHPAEMGGPLEEELVGPDEAIATNIHTRNL